MPDQVEVIQNGGVILPEEGKDRHFFLPSFCNDRIQAALGTLSEGVRTRERSEANLSIIFACAMKNGGIVSPNSKRLHDDDRQGYRLWMNELVKSDLLHLVSEAMPGKAARKYALVFPKDVLEHLLVRPTDHDEFVPLGQVLKDNRFKDKILSGMVKCRGGIAFTSGVVSFKLPSSLMHDYCMSWPDFREFYLRWHRWCERHGLTMNYDLIGGSTAVAPGLVDTVAHAEFHLTGDPAVIAAEHLRRRGHVGCIKAKVKAAVDGLSRLRQRRTIAVSTVHNRSYSALTSISKAFRSMMMLRNPNGVLEHVVEVDVHSAFYSAAVSVLDERLGRIREVKTALSNGCFYELLAEETGVICDGSFKALAVEQCFFWKHWDKRERPIFDAACRLMPGFGDWVGLCRSIGGSRFMYKMLTKIESSLMRPVWERLHRTGGDYYPLHDGILVPESLAESCRDFLVENLQRVIGFCPAVNMKAC